MFDNGLERRQANFAALSPLSFLARSAATYPDKAAVVHGERSITYRAFYERCRRFASALTQRGIGQGDTVSIMASNIPAMLEAHYGPAMAGAVLNPLNIRLDARAIAFILEHGGAKLILVDREFSNTVADALAMMESPPPAIDIDDPLYDGAGPVGGGSGVRGVSGKRRSRLRLVAPGTTNGMRSA